MVEIVKEHGIKTIADGHYKFVVVSVNSDNYTVDNPTVINEIEIVQNKNKNLNGLKTIKVVSFKDVADNFLAEWLKAMGYSDKDMSQDNFTFNTDDFIGKIFEADYNKEGKYAVLSNMRSLNFKQSKVED